MRKFVLTLSVVGATIVGIGLNGLARPELISPPGLSEKAGADTYRLPPGVAATGGGLIVIGTPSEFS